MTDASQIRRQIDSLNERASEVVVTLRLQKALLEELAIEYGNLGGLGLAYSEGLLEAVEKQLTEPITSILLAIRHANDWVGKL